LFEKPEGKRQLGRARHKWEYIKIDLKETGFGGVDCIHLGQERDSWLEEELLHTTAPIGLPFISISWLF
jgi:hypothetical protein